MENSEILDQFQPSSTGGDGLQIDADMQADLLTASRWGNILAIIGFVITGIGALIGLIMIVGFSSMSAFGAMPGMEGIAPVMVGAGIIYMAVLLLYILPLVYLRRFATSMKAAIDGDGSQSLATSFQNLGRLFKFLGIFTLVLIGVYIVFYIVMIVVYTSSLSAMGAF
jgi:hypothetical protein